MGPFSPKQPTWVNQGASWPPGRVCGPGWVWGVWCQPLLQPRCLSQTTGSRRPGPETCPMKPPEMPALLVALTGQVCAGWALEALPSPGSLSDPPPAAPLGEAREPQVPAPPITAPWGGEGAAGWPPRPDSGPRHQPQVRCSPEYTECSCPAGPLPARVRLLFRQEEPLSQRGRLDAGGTDGQSGSGGPCHPTPNPGPWGSGPQPLLSALRPPPLPAQRGHPGPPRSVPAALPPSRVAPGVTVLAGTC